MNVIKIKAIEAADKLSEKINKMFTFFVFIFGTIFIVNLILVVYDPNEDAVRQGIFKFLDNKNSFWILFVNSFILFLRIFNNNNTECCLFNKLN